MAWCGHETEQAGCRKCELVRTRADYRALWGRPEPVRAAAPRRGIDLSKPRMTFDQLAAWKRH